jgi:hypothetical protein
MIAVLLAGLVQRCMVGTAPVTSPEDHSTAQHGGNNA